MVDAKDGSNYMYKCICPQYCICEKEPGGFAVSVTFANCPLCVPLFAHNTPRRKPGDVASLIPERN